MHVPAPERAASVLHRSGLGRHPRDWRVPPIETYPRLVAFVQTDLGKALLFLLFASLMYPLSDWWLEGTVSAAAVSLAGRYRRHVALLCGAVLLVHLPGWFDYDPVLLAVEREGLYGAVPLGWLRAATLVACVPLAVAALWLAQRFRDHPLGRRPLLAEHLLMLGLLVAAGSHLLGGWPQVLLWSLIAVFAAYFWFLAYALIDMRQRQPQPILSHLATFHPFFSPNTVVPMGKGASNWRSTEAATAEELAVTQLKGVKLLCWAFFLKIVLWSFHRIVYDRLGVPPLWLAFDDFLQGDGPGTMGLVSIAVNFPEQLLEMALWGHVIIATARLAGFRLMRNTWRPLSSRTIAEFWNRYFYYFKEVLVHVYFYPTYLRCFKRHPRLRLAFATFMAAGVGNYFFHFILDLETSAGFGLLDDIVASQTYAFYCLLLSGGIVLSQLRARPPSSGQGWVRRQLLPSAWVALFYCVLSFFDGPQGHVALSLHFDFLLHVFGIDRWIGTTG